MEERSLVRHTLMELSALLGELRALVEDGDSCRYHSDARYRWAIHRLWIAIGNEVQYLGQSHRYVEPWRSLRLLRNRLAHARLPDVDDGWVWRITVLRPPELLGHLERMSA